MQPIRKTYFNDLWISNNNKIWLDRGSTKEEAKCKLCKSVFQLGNMRETSLKCHAMARRIRNMFRNMRKCSLSSS